MQSQFIIYTSNDDYAIIYDQKSQQYFVSYPGSTQLLTDHPFEYAADAINFAIENQPS